MESSECVSIRGLRSERLSFGWGGQIGVGILEECWVLESSQLGMGGTGVERPPKDSLRGQRWGGLGTSWAWLSVGHVKVKGEKSGRTGTLGAGSGGHPSQRLSRWQTPASTRSGSVAGSLHRVVNYM